jgi:DNA-binding NtrC family response regulator
MALPAERHYEGHMVRVVLCACDRSTGNALQASLSNADLEVLHCAAVESLIEEVVRHRPEVVVYELRSDFQADLAVLHLLKRAAPDLPLVLITADGSLKTERLMRELRPVYYAVQPVEPGEILDAVHSALAKRAGRHGV